MSTLLVLAQCLLASAPAPSDGGTAPDYLGAAQGLATELSTQDFAKGHRRFAPEIARALPVKKLEAQWLSMVAELGAFQKLGATRAEEDPQGKRVLVECVHEKGSLTIRVALNERLQVIGLRPVPAQTGETFEATARAAVAELAAAAYPKLVGRFDATMQKVLPADKLAQAWEGVLADWGAFGRVLEAKLEPDARYGIVDLECAFAKKSGVVRIVLDGQLKVTGLFFKPAWSPPDYAEAAKFEERPVTVGTPALPLPGTLTLPRAEGPFPAVVLVHGSGPNDADESFGPNKLFKDLAWGLGSRGIAVLRFEKRTHRYRGKLSNADLPTVKEESVDDAQSAVALLAKTPEIDAKRIFVVGHSLGALLAPRIAASDEKVRGIVMLAGPSRPQWHLVVEQLKYLTGLEGKRSEAGEKVVREAEANARKLDDPSLSPKEVVDGIPGSYWLDLRNYEAAKVLQKLGRPVLIVQGGRDYQVTQTDFEGWKKVLKGQKHIGFKLHPALNHHLMPGSGRSTPAEYQQPNHVPLELIEELAQWLRTH